MTWTPITVPVRRWTLRCDGQTARGLCEQLVCHNTDDEPDTAPETTLWAEPVLDRWHEEALDWNGWLVLRDGRVLCPDHLAACEYQVRAALDGLPFPDTHPSPGVDSAGADSAGADR